MEGETKPFDWKEYLSKHGLWAVLSIALLYFIRTDMIVPLIDNLRSMSASMENIEKGQEKLLYLTSTGAWRSSEPPTPSAVENRLDMP